MANSVVFEPQEIYKKNSMSKSFKSYLIPDLSAKNLTTPKAISDNKGSKVNKKTLCFGILAVSNSDLRGLT